MNELPDHGKINPNAPQELLAFDFLVGKWKCEVTIRQENGDIAHLEATWEGRYILDGYVIADEFEMRDSSDSLVMLGMNYRSFDPEAQTWNMKWLEARSGKWLDLGPEELGGVEVTDGTISFKAEFRPGEIHQISFSHISQNQFTWTVDISTDDGQNWNESVMTIRATRVQSGDKPR